MKEIEINQIENSVPIPVNSPHHRTGVPTINALEIGQSIVYPNERRRSIQAYASKLKKDKDMLFTVRSLDKDTFRVWRMK